MEASKFDTSSYILAPWYILHFSCLLGRIFNDTVRDQFWIEVSYMHVVSWKNGEEKECIRDINLLSLPPKAAKCACLHVAGMHSRYLYLYIAVP